MSIDIKTLRKGDSVVFKYPEKGTKFQKLIALNCLIKDAIYIVEDKHLLDFHTDIYLKHFDVPFNSCMFELSISKEYKDIISDYQTTLQNLIDETDKRLDRPFDLVEYMREQLPILSHFIFMRKRKEIDSTKEEVV